MNLRNIFQKKWKTSFPRVAIYGQYKTGTTACFLRIKNSLRPAPRELFEQPVYTPHPDDHKKPVLAKVIIPPDPNLYALKVPGANPYDNLMQKAEAGIASFRSFDKHILLLRDPRDRIVSGTLFIPQERQQVYENDEVLNQLLDILHRKEQNPRSVSMLEILCTILQDSPASVWQRITNLIERHHAFIFAFEQSLGKHVKWKYEDMIAGKAEHVEEYLGFKFSGGINSEEKYGHVKRAGMSGDWRHWFTEEDVDFFKPLMATYLERYRYNRSWDLQPNPFIKPEHASGYVFRTVQRKRAPAIGNHDLPFRNFSSDFHDQ
ncbi:MAG: hypothetical protein ACLFPE_10960 [Bacteroidales bacterium]